MGEQLRALVAFAASSLHLHGDSHPAVPPVPRVHYILLMASLGTGMQVVQRSTRRQNTHVRSPLLSPHEHYTHLVSRMSRKVDLLVLSFKSGYWVQRSNLPQCASGCREVTFKFCPDSSTLLRYLQAVMGFSSLRTMFCSSWNLIVSLILLLFKS